MTKFILFASFVAVIVSSVARADPLQGLYIGGAGGVNFTPALKADQNTDKFTTDPGGIGVATLGWAFGNGFRTEISGSYSSNPITSISTRRVNGTFAPLTGESGRQSDYSVMANIMYDLPVSSLNLPFQPYVGAGVGYNWMDFNGASGSESLNLKTQYGEFIGFPGIARYGSANSFAYEVITGLSLPVLSVPGLNLTIEDRLSGAALAKERTTLIIPEITVNGSAISATRTSGYHPINNAVLVGLRYSFGSK